MGQVTIYLNNDLEKKIKKMAQLTNVSISKYIASMLEQKISDEWSPNVKAMAGSWSDFPEPEALRKESAADIKREAL